MIVFTGKSASEFRVIRLLAEKEQILIEDDAVYFFALPLCACNEKLFAVNA